MIITDLFDIDFHIFTDIKILFNLWVRIKYIIICSYSYRQIIYKNTTTEIFSIILRLRYHMEDQVLPRLGIK